VKAWQFIAGLAFIGLVVWAVWLYAEQVHDYPPTTRCAQSHLQPMQVGKVMLLMPMCDTWEPIK